MNALEMSALISEMNIAIAGFAGIVSAFRFQDLSNVRRSSVAALTLIVQGALIVALFGLLPLILSSFDITGKNLWRTSSIVIVLLCCAMMYVIHQYFQGTLAALKTRLIYTAGQLMMATGVLVNALNALDVFFHAEPGPYLLVGVLGSVLAGWMFMRLLLNPLWKHVKENEAREKDSATPDR